MPQHREFIWAEKGRIEFLHTPRSSIALQKMVAQMIET